MRAVWFERNGGADVLEARDVPEPTAADGQVLVDVEAVGVNFRDVYEREGNYGSKPPAILGAEGAGTTESGERVAWSDVPRTTRSASQPTRASSSRSRTASRPSRRRP